MTRSRNLDRWDAQLKSLVDNASVKVVVTGSSALRIELGWDSLAGRINTIEAGVLSLTEIGALRGFPTPKPFLRDNGLADLLDKGVFGWPCASMGLNIAGFVARLSGISRIAGAIPSFIVRRTWNFLNWPIILTRRVIKRVIQHDLRIGERGRKRDENLLEELFRLVCRYAGQTPRTATLVEEARFSLSANIGSQRVTHYLKFLGDTLLLRLIPPLEIRLKRRRGSPKLCLVDHGLRASWLQETHPPGAG